jgi:hypothetical protein
VPDKSTCFFASEVKKQSRCAVPTINEISQLIRKERFVNRSLGVKLIKMDEVTNDFDSLKN